MKYLKMLGLAAVAAMALAAFTAGSASATTLEVEGVAKNVSVTIAASLEPETSAVLKDTAGISSNTCTESNVHGSTVTPFTGTTVTGPLTEGEGGLSFGKCQRTVVVHKSGTLHVEWISGTTDGTLVSSGAEVTTGSPFGTLNCKTGTGVDIGRLTGTKTGHATIDINATLSCSSISSKWEAKYLVTTPTGLGVVN